MEGFSKIYKGEYYERFLSCGVRPDGRGLNSSRQVSVTRGSIGSSDGSAMVRMGNTTVLAGVRAEVGAPLVDVLLDDDDEKAKRKKRRTVEEEGEGEGEEGGDGDVNLVVSVELLPICNASFRPGKPPAEASVLSSQLNRIFRNKKIIDPQLLKIPDSKLKWYLYVDVYCLAHDGNLTDATILAVSAALTDTKIPRIVVTESDTKITREEGEREGGGGVVGGWVPVGVTFSMIDRTMVVDPTNEEEGLSVASISIVRLEQVKIDKKRKGGEGGGKVGMVSVSGEKGVGGEELVECMRLSGVVSGGLMEKFFG